jgi:radical SAM enzyme (TIGR01210 family)
VSVAAYAAQMKAVMERVRPGDGPVQVDLFVSGSFFNPDEVPAEAQTMILERAAVVPGVTRILVETRPEYVSGDALARAVRSAGDIPLEVAIGLESADEEIRERRIHKGFNWGQFEDAARRIAVAGPALQVYVLLKPLDTCEAEAVEDAVESATRVFALGGDLGLSVRVALEPCFVAPDTRLAEAFGEGRYRPPWLWSVVEVVRRVAALGPVQVGLSDEGLQPARVAHNCDRCTPRFREALAAFNVDGAAERLSELDCTCRQEWQREMDGRC